MHSRHRFPTITLSLRILFGVVILAGLGDGIRDA